MSTRKNYEANSGKKSEKKKHVALRLSPRFSLRILSVAMVFQKDFPRNKVPNSN